LLTAFPVCFLLACGAQGPPHPPRIEQPEKIKDLAVAQVGRKLEISFTAPTLATDGERLSKPIAVQIFRSVTPAGQKPAEAPPALKPWVVLPSHDLTRYTQTQTGKVEYAEPLSDQEFPQSVGSTFTFAVRALTRGFRGHPVESEFSNMTQVAVLDVSGPPENLEARTTEKAVELSWSRPGQSLSGHPISNLSGYRIYRSERGQPSSLQPRGETQSEAYADADFQFGHTYSYKVRAVFGAAGRRAETEDSLPVEITPHDAFPPAAPTRLSAVYAAQVVELIWTANTEPDLAGYNVYRREESGTSHRVNKELLPTPLYRDSSVEAGRKYSYQVTAVDLAGNESPTSGEVWVETR
jgi:fibronectin type III domain protein